MQAILSNAQHPEYGEVTIPFPIGENEYGRCLELLGKMEIGNPIERDCFIRALLVEHGLTERHARCLLRLEDEGERLTALRQAAAKHWNVAQTEQYVERRLAALQTAPPAGRRTYIIKDVRLFLNSVDRGLRLIRDAGVDARTEREETEDEIVLTLRIPKQRRKEA